MTRTVECEGRTVREINSEIRRLIAEGVAEILVQDPAARHNLGVALTQPVALRFDGSVGYYCAGMSDGADITINGSAGWGVAEGMMNGTVRVQGDAGSGAAAAIRGGTVAIQGDAAARAGVSMKGGTLLIGGECGYMTGFMGQKGRIIVCGDAGEALGDSMYETVIFVGGKIQDLGNDAVVEDPDESDLDFLHTTLTTYGLDPARDWKRVVSGRKLWNFDQRDAVWRSIL